MRQLRRVRSLQDLLQHSRVGNVCGEVDGESDRHDDCDHGDAVEVDAPQRHVSNYTCKGTSQHERSPPTSFGV